MPWTVQMNQQWAINYLINTLAHMIKLRALTISTFNIGNPNSTYSLSQIAQKSLEDAKVK